MTAQRILRRHSGARPKARLRASSTRYGREPGIQSRNRTISELYPGKGPSNQDWILDQPNLPLPTPLLDFFFTGNRSRRIVVGFKPDQTINIVPGRKSWRSFSFVLIYPPYQIPGDAKIERPVFPAGQEIDKHRPAVRLDSGLAGNSASKTRVNALTARAPE